MIEKFEISDSLKQHRYMDYHILGLITKFKFLFNHELQELWN